jgi:hypothetical protein
MNSQLENHILEIQTYGFTVISGGNKDSDTFLSLIKKIYKESSVENKSLHTERSSDGMVYNLQNRDIKFINLLMNNEVQSILKFFLNDEFYQVQDPELANFILSYYNARSTGSFLDLHIDSLVPAPGDLTWAMQVAFVLEDMTEENGCTVVVPGSHKSGKFTDRSLQKRFPLVAKAGDIAIWDSRLWHGTLDNLSGKSRWVLIATFTRWWVKQTMDMTKKLPEEIYSCMTDAEKLMLGFCSIPPSDEYGSIHTKKSYAELKSKVADYNN